MLEKTAESIIIFTQNKDDSDIELNAALQKIYHLIDEVGTLGGWYIGDGIDMKVSVSYKNLTQKTLNYDIPINNKADVDRINEWYQKEYPAEYKEKHGIILYHPMEYHIKEFLEKIVELMQETYYENNEPISGSVIVKTVATYEPENK